ncbi:hypothetical protein, partial [Burkholderia gladioli]|uniref:hypothetical protein n=1 Tax=Burkholderia gladioli TaxID=28095 RepID=UPI001ABB6894
NTARRASFASEQILQPKRERVSGYAGASPYRAVLAESALGWRDFQRHSRPLEIFRLAFIFQCEMPILGSEDHS